MTFAEQRDYALAMMASKGMWRSNYAPPMMRLIWKLGISMPPPPFAPFWQNTLLFGGYFTLAWGVLMWLMSWRDSGYSLTFAVINALCAGMLFGVLMAAFHYWRRRANHLPDWESLSGK